MGIHHGGDHQSGLKAEVEASLNDVSFAMQESTVAWVGQQEDWMGEMRVQALFSFTLKGENREQIHCAACLPHGYMQIGMDSGQPIIDVNPKIKETLNACLMAHPSYAGNVHVAPLHSEHHL